MELVQQKDASYYKAQKGEDRFYVYIHRRLSDGKPFYVGKGQGDRAWYTNNRSQFWKNIENKHGFSVDIVFDGLDENTAFQCEKDIILELKYFGNTLCNLTDGGDGVSGAKFSEEVRKRMSASHRNSPATRKRIDNQRGKKHSEEHKKKISEAGKGRVNTQEQIARNSASRRIKTIYEFMYIESERVFVGTRHELEKEGQLTRMQVSQLFTTRALIVSKGWSLIGEYVEGNEDQTRFQEALNKAKNNKTVSAETRKKRSDSMSRIHAEKRKTVEEL